MVGIETQVYKYGPLDVPKLVHLSLPRLAQFMHMEVVNNEVFMWWLVPMRELELESFTRRTFFTVPTGPPTSDVPLIHYVGTYILDGGGFVGHLFADEAYPTIYD